MDTQSEVRTLAYHLWQDAGAPEGRDLEFWLRAEAALSRNPPAAKTAAKPAARSRRKAQPGH